jgi:transposase
VTVQHIHERVEGRGLRPETITERLNLSLADVYEALAYYHRNPEEIQKLEETIEERTGSLKGTQLLMTIPGVGHYTALTIYAELGEIDRFDGDNEVVSYVGLNLNPVIRELGVVSATFAHSMIVKSN